MVWKIFKEPLFLMGILTIFFMLTVSIFYSLFTEPPQPLKSILVYNENGQLIGKHPLPPSEEYLLGTDSQGVSMVYKIIQGAKYTIGFAIIVALLRMILSLLASIAFSTSLRKLRPTLKSFSDSFTYAPSALVVYIILSPVVVIYSWAFTGPEKVLLTFTCLTLIALPTLTFIISEEVTEIGKHEFITSARSLGSSRVQILWRHVVPFLLPRLFILFAQQIVQVLLLFAHLGILGLFIGGTNLIVEDSSLEMGNQPEMISSSLSYEWAGLIAAARDVINIYPWMIYPPVIALTLTILAMIFIVEGLKSAFLDKKPFTIKRRAVNQTKDQGDPINHESFEFLNDNQKIM
ncbi:ABC transporter permease [Virgibacillus kekensis]|uniref:ABC transporter permease n=1 Tax=Virgibacillus kekensis TaxID=202261 RepID=A0ABV9DED4_9BACI